MRNNLAGFSAESTRQTQKQKRAAGFASRAR